MSSLSKKIAQDLFDIITINFAGVSAIANVISEDGAESIADAKRYPWGGAGSLGDAISILLDSARARTITDMEKIVEQYEQEAER